MAAAIVAYTDQDDTMYVEGQTELIYSQIASFNGRSWVKLKSQSKHQPRLQWRG